MNVYSLKDYRLHVNHAEVRSLGSINPHAYDQISQIYYNEAMHMLMLKISLPQNNYD